MKKDKKLEIKPDVLEYMKDDLRVYRTPNNQFYITDSKETFRSDLYKDMEQAIRTAIDMKRKIY